MRRLMNIYPGQRFYDPNRRGAALVLVLCMVVLMTGLIISFISRASMARQISNASANNVKVEILGESALKIVVDDLRQEIIKYSTTSGSGTNIIYIPTSATYASPIRKESLTSLLRRSSTSDSTTRAANVSTTVASLNGRFVSRARWNSHFLLPLSNASTVGDSTPVSSFTAPDWVLVARTGPVSNATWNKSYASTTQSNDSYIIGRYAYAIYDEGSLLDANAAGYPSISTTTQSGTKGGLAYADLRELGLTSAQIDQLVGWRNFANTQPSGTFPALSINSTGANLYKTRVTASTNNFIAVSPTTYQGNTDHSFSSRQQLIKFLQSLSSASSDQLKFQTALQKLGTFSREVNGPTWAPGVNYTSPYDYKSQQNSTSSTTYNPFILSTKVKSTFTRANGTQAVIGEPLVKYRFPLEKLSLLEKLKGASSLSSQDKDDIARYFGLDVMADSTGYYRHWSYPTSNSKYPHTSGAILSLNDVAGKNREPDFFELLQAGIYAGSLGRGGKRGDITLFPSTPTFVDPDTKTIYQILRIGANIIDQWDTDNYPTTITLASTGDNIYGIEDLPYINEFLYTVSGPGTYGSPYTQNYTFAISFQLWNPHQALTNTGAYPPSYRLSPAVTDTYQIKLISEYPIGSGTYYYWYWSVQNQSWSTSSSNPDYFSDLQNSSGVITVPLADHSSEYREPSQTSTLSTVMNGFPPDSLPVKGKTYSELVTLKAYLWFDLVVNVIYRIEFSDQNGTYHPYGTFVGLDNPSGTLPGSGYRQSPWLQFSPATKVGWYPSPKSDPRTSRFGSAQSTEYDTESATQSLTPGPVSTYKDIYSRITSQMPFLGNSSATTPSSNPYRIDKWAVNDPTGGSTSTPSNPAYADNDGQTRPADARYGSIAPYFNAANGGTRVRPLVLNRPFRSVGELGYVYRDMPWKTLDFFSDLSADAALLDLFSLNGGQSLLAGRLNPNASQKEVLAAVIAGVTQSEKSGTTVSSSSANSIAQAIINLSAQQPFINRADLVTRLMKDASISSLSDVKSDREAIVRAMADCANTRTWNLLIDLVAQSGKYPTTATGLTQFQVEGEKHYWLHVAIDRYTGQVIDQSLEVVRE